MTSSPHPFMPGTRVSFRMKSTPEIADLTGQEAFDVHGTIQDFKFEDSIAFDPAEKGSFREAFSEQGWYIVRADDGDELWEVKPDIIERLDQS